MSDLIPFDVTGANLPAFMKNNQHTSTIEDQVLGGQINKITQAEGYIVMEENGIRSAPQLAIDVVILDAYPRGRDTYRAYYEGTWKEGDASAPACYSADGKVPSPHAEKPQCSTCMMCPKNIKGSSATGEGRACGFFKYLAVTTYPNLDKIYRLKVSNRSLFNSEPQGVPSPLGMKMWTYGDYVKDLQRKKMGWEQLVTKVSLPKGQTHGFFFSPSGWLPTEEAYNKVLELSNDPIVQEVLSVELSGVVGAMNAEYSYATALPAPQASATLPPPAPPAQAPLTGRDKWLASVIIPQNVKEWITKVDDATALNYLEKYYSSEV